MHFHKKFKKEMCSFHFKEAKTSPSNKVKRLRQWSPTFLATETGFVEDNFFLGRMGRGGGVGGDGVEMIQTHYIQSHLLLCDWVPNRPQTGTGLLPEVGASSAKA